MKHIEFCAGIGGMHSGLKAAGWECLLAIDNDPDAVAVHRLAHGSCTLADVTSLIPEDLPEADAWVAGFPCQPFSSSGNRRGFAHHSGNVFEHLSRLIEIRRPSIVILENVEGLLTNKSGHTFSVILSKLTAMRYTVSWLLIDLRWFGPPQSRPRLFVIAVQPGIIQTTYLQNIDELLPCFQENQINAFSQLMSDNQIVFKKRSHGSLSALEHQLTPAIGKPKPKDSSVFGTLGYANDNSYNSFNITKYRMANVDPTLASIVAPNFNGSEKIRSARYYARGGPTSLYLRSELISHCVGTSLGGAPLYAVPLSSISNLSDRNAFLEYSNWHREQDDLLVMRLRPDRAVLLFGSHTDRIHKAVNHWDAGDTRKYKLVGNMVAPICAKEVGDLINKQLLKKHVL